jgi:hypothetical protein
MRWLICLSILAAFRAAAHPGHSPLEHGIGHTLMSPHHFLPLLAFGLVLIVFARLVKHRRSSLVLRWIGATKLVVGAGGWLLAP